MIQSTKSAAVKCILASNPHYVCTGIMPKIILAIASLSTFISRSCASTENPVHFEAISCLSPLVSYKYKKPLMKLKEMYNFITIFMFCLLTFN